MKSLGSYFGTVAEYKVEKGFGFIRIEGEVVDGELIECNDFKDQAFIHFKDIEPDKSHEEFFKKLYQGDVVRFELYRDGKRLKAKNLTCKGAKYDDNGDINGNKETININGNS